MTPSEYGLKLLKEGYSVTEAAERIVNEYPRYKEEPTKER